MRVLRNIQKLGDRVERLWSEANYDRLTFPRIAGACLEEFRLHESFDEDLMLRWSLQAKSIPRQLALHGDFGDPPVTLYWNDRFAIDALFWLAPSTAVHDHSFSGAFTVLKGLSLQCAYSFDAREKRHPGIFFGRLRPGLTELLKPGDVRPIRCGSEFIHAVWHLARPTVSLVVRTHGDIKVQHSYSKPGVAVDARSVARESLLNPLMVKRLALMRLLAQVDRRKKEDYARELVAAPDLLHAYIYLAHYCRLTPDHGERGGVLKAARRKHGRAVSLIAESIRGDETAADCPWDRVKDQGPRLLLALASSLGDMGRVREVVAGAYPRTSADELIARWSRQIPDCGLRADCLPSGKPR